MNLLCYNIFSVFSFQGKRIFFPTVSRPLSLWKKLKKYIVFLLQPSSSEQRVPNQTGTRLSCSPVYYKCVCTVVSVMQRTRRAKSGSRLLRCNVGLLFYDNVSLWSNNNFIYDFQTIAYWIRRYCRPTWRKQYYISLFDGSSGDLLPKRSAAWERKTDRKQKSNE